MARVRGPEVQAHWRLAAGAHRTVTLWLRGGPVVLRSCSAWTVAALALSFLLAATTWGCRGETAGIGPYEEGMRNTLEGSYQVKATEGDKVLGVGIYCGGSFRIVMEGVPRVVIYNREEGRGWMINLQRRTYREMDLEETTKRAGFLPSQVMKPCFDLPSFWNGGEFHMHTQDGRSIVARLDGPGHLPSLWEAVSPGGTIKRLEWEYRRVGEVSEDNFRVPEGLALEE